jgi:hypothetical protein
MTNSPLNSITERERMPLPEKVTLQIETLVRLLQAQCEQFEDDFIMSKWQHPERIKNYLESSQELHKHLEPDERSRAVMTEAKLFYNSLPLPF